jgi:glycosyltransferase involved in cell wall biosynthesis
MRVLLVGDYPTESPSRGGGVETSFVNLVQGLKELDPGLDLHVTSFVRRQEGERHADRDGFVIHFVEAPERLTNLTLHMAKRRALRRLVLEVQPDVVHAQNAVSHGYACLKAAPELPVVVAIHGILKEELKFASRRVRIQAAFTTRPLQRYCIRHARYLTQPTSYPERYFGDAIRGSIVDVGNAVSDVFFSTERRPRPGRVLFTGGIFPRKRVLELVEATARLRRHVPDITVHVCGNVRHAPYAELVRERTRQLGLETAVRFLGAVTPEQLLEEYASASVFVLPSARETSPISIAEAMAMGIPVVATDVGGVRELVGDGGHVIQLDDQQSFDDRLVDLLTDVKSQEALSRAARARAEGFRADVVAARVHSVYETALAQRPDRATSLSQKSPSHSPANWEPDGGTVE